MTTGDDKNSDSVEAIGKSKAVHDLKGLTAEKIIICEIYALC